MRSLVVRNTENMHEGNVKQGLSSWCGKGTLLWQANSPNSYTLIHYFKVQWCREECGPNTS